MWNLPPPPGFQGIHPEKPLTVYHRHLPHWRQDGATYFVTFRLDDSLPQNKLNELAAIREDWERRHALRGTALPSRPGAAAGARDRRRTARESRPTESDEAREELARRVQERIEHWLDQGMGRCLLRQSKLAAFVTIAMHHFDNDRYELGCYVVMPNHAHAIVRPLNPDSQSLEDVLGSWKKYSARRINRELREDGELWQDESFDRIIRDEEHLWRAVQYIGANPAKAGLARGSCPLWIRPQWVELGWRFDEPAMVKTAQESRPT
jgi:putative transposase